MMILVDANVLSETTKPIPDENVIRWLRTNERGIVVSPVVLGEIEYEILIMPKGKKRTTLETWFEHIAQTMEVLDFDRKTAATWAGLLATLKRKGWSMPLKDSLIAATALHHKLSLATRNTADFKQAGIRLINPFTS
jgi:predicted nucleic acid-binding protein